MSDRLPPEMTLEEYLSTPETNRSRELACGRVREPAPSWDHQVIVGATFAHLQWYVAQRRLGQVVMSPLDVVLDAAKSLVVQPDIVFVSQARMHLIRTQLWGAPDLVAEVLSASTRAYDRQQKREWYARYGVREQWTLDPLARTIEVTTFAGTSPHETTVFAANDTVRSSVFPKLRLRVARAFEA